MHTVFLLALLLIQRPDGGVWAQPHRDPAQLTAADVDVQMWPIVQRINQSGWVWTTESCQGHIDGYPPTLGLVTDAIGRALELFSVAVVREAAPWAQGERQDPQSLHVDLSYFVHPQLTKGRYQVRLVIRAATDAQRDRARQVFAGFAQAVTP